MYHCKDDIRVTRSANMLYEALMKLLKSRPLSAITISDVSHVSTVSRATFYRNFDEVTDLLSWKMDQLFEEVLTGFVTSSPDLHKEDALLIYVMRYWMKEEHARLLEVLFENGRIDIIYQGFVNKANILLEYLKKRGMMYDLDDFEYFISVRAGFFVGIICAWIKNGKKETPEEIVTIIAKQHDDVVNNELIL